MSSVMQFNLVSPPEKTSENDNHNNSHSDFAIFQDNGDIPNNHSKNHKNSQPKHSDTDFIQDNGDFNHNNNNNNNNNDNNIKNYMAGEMVFSATTTTNMHNMTGQMVNNNYNNIQQQSKFQPSSFQPHNLLQSLGCDLYGALFLFNRQYIESIHYHIHVA